MPFYLLKNEVTKRLILALSTTTQGTELFKGPSNTVYDDKKKEGAYTKPSSGIGSRPTCSSGVKSVLVKCGWLIMVRKKT